MKNNDATANNKTSNKSNNKKKEKIGKFYIILWSFFTLTFLTIGFVNLKSYYHLNQNVAELEQEYATLEQENEDLAYQLEHLGDESSIKDSAREELGLYESNEIIFDIQTE